MFELSVNVMRRSDGSVLFDDFNFGSEVFGHLVLVRLWSKHHPLVPHRSLTVARMVASGLIGTSRFENEARYEGLRVKSHACANRLPSCYTKVLVRPLKLANLRAPMVLYGVGVGLAVLALVVEVASAQVTKRRHQAAASALSGSVDPIP